MSKIPEWAREQAQAFHDKWDTGMSGAAFNDFALALVAAEKRGIERAAKLIEEGYERVVAHAYRDDGRPSKNDECGHGKYEYEDCEQCAAAAIRQLGESHE